MPRQFKIEFDNLQGHSPSTGATIGAEQLNPYGWRSIGASKGGRFANRTGGILRAIHIKTNKPGDTLGVTPESGGGLFPTIWFKNDLTEAIFMDANVPINPSPASKTGAFWMHVPRNDQQDIEYCDACHDVTKPQPPCTNNQGGPCLECCPFTGQVFRNNPPDPPAANWQKIRSDLQRMKPQWRELMTVCPSSFRSIQAYGETPDGRYTMFIADGDLLLFDATTRTVSILEAPSTEFSMVNHVSFHKNTAVLEWNGVPIRTIHFGPEKAGFYELGNEEGSVPTPSRRKDRGTKR